MNDLKKEAVAALDELRLSTNLPYDTYSLLHDAITDIELLEDRDEELRDLWGEFEDVPMNPETECIEQPFLGWGAGVRREEIWHWFDKRYSGGVYALLYGEGGPHSELFSLMKSHPELPVVPMVDGEVHGDDDSWYIGSFGKAQIGEYALYGDKWYDDRDGFKEDYYDCNDDWLCEQFSYDPRIDEFTVKYGEYTQDQLDENDKNEKRMNEYLDQVAEQMFKKAILVYIGEASYRDYELSEFLPW